ncbi:23 kDa jasmonate-induced protein-like [Silene latifolia]|uniref:23 kDa jasmonate-induced protein-like n=1 Tax=Silene latifolia TaxID=37657 RepID=UPI003D77AF51
MATSVFGAPITFKTVTKSDKCVGKDVTTRDLAEMAFRMKNAEGKGMKAREFVEERRTKYGGEYTMCLIYNATGDTMRMITYSDAGDGFVSPSPYPMLIMNGQLGAYLKRGGGAVVYAIKNEHGSEFQVVYTYWSLQPGRVYTDIKQRDFYKLKDPWQSFLPSLEASQSYIYQAHEFGLSSFASIGGTTWSPVFEGIITLDGAWPNYSKVKPYYPPPTGYPSSRQVLIGEGIEDEATTEQDAGAIDA